MPRESRTLSTGFLCFALAALPLVSGCSTLRLAGQVTDTVKAVASADDTQVSLTLLSGPELPALIQGLSEYDVQADIEAVEQGVTIVRLVGAYQEVLRTINWILIEGTRALLANDEASELILQVAVAFLKSGG